MNEEWVYIDLFSGTGGFPYGFHKAGLTFTYHYFSEIDKYAIANFKYNFKDAIYAGDIRFISGPELRKRHPNAKFIITFGFPCQDLSIAGKGAGFDGKRSVLFFEAIRLITETRPEIFIFENVKGILSHNEGETFEIVLRTIANLGIYDCEWQLLNTSWILPQNRERIYFVGHSAGSGFKKVFPFREADFIHSEQNRNEFTGIANCIDSNYHKGWLDHGQRTHIVCLTETRTQEAKNMRKESMKKGRDYSPRRGKKLIERNDLNANTITSTQSFEQLISISNTITPDAYLTTGKRKRDENGKSVLTSMNERRIRRLTEIECERLQGFPDNWTKYGIFEKQVWIAMTLEEDHYIDPENSDNGCFAESDAKSIIEDKDQYPEGMDNLNKVYDKGHPILWEEF